MGKAIVVGITLIALGLILFLIIAYVRRAQSKDDRDKALNYQNGDLNRGQETAILAQLRSAEEIFRKLIMPVDVWQLETFTSGTILGSDDRDRINLWLQRNSTALPNTLTKELPR